MRKRRGEVVIEEGQIWRTRRLNPNGASGLKIVKAPTNGTITVHKLGQSGLPVGQPLEMNVRSLRGDYTLETGGTAA